VFDASRFRQHSVFACLPTPIETGLEFTFSGRNYLQSTVTNSIIFTLLTTTRGCTHQYRQIGLGGTTNHVWNETLVAGRVQNCEMFTISLKVSASHFDRFAFVAFCECGICCDNRQ
jgi:hypothetical protein